MKLLLLIASALCVLGNGCAVASPQSRVAAAPPWKCELNLTAWCIAEGAYEITRQLANDSVHDRVWSMRGRFKPESKVVILEPNGCKSGYSDTLELLKFDRGVQWENHSWDRLQARLKSDGSCDLTIYLTSYDGDSMEWAFTSGLPLVRPCKDEACENVGLGELRPQIEKKLRAASK